jgi:hypothetical protein
MLTIMLKWPKKSKKNLKHIKGTNSTERIDCHTQVAQEEEEFERNERIKFHGT